jgi:Tol biopolymer transport system component
LFQSIRFGVVTAVLTASATAYAVPTPLQTLVCECEQPGNISLHLADNLGANERPLPIAPGYNYNASFSADGQWIVFTSEQPRTADVYRVHPDGSGLERLTNHPAFDDQGALSPDGKRLAFVSTRETGFANLWVMDLATRRVTRLTQVDAGNFRPSWSPDGKWIAFSSDRDTKAGRRPASGIGGWELMQLSAIYVLRADGSGLRRLSPLDQVAGSPRWSPDGRRLVFYRATNMNADPQVVSMNVADGSEEILTRPEQRATLPYFIGTGEIGWLEHGKDDDWRKATLVYRSGARSSTGAFENPSWSPDGKTVVFQKINFRREHPWMEPQPGIDARYRLLANTTGGFFPALSADGKRFVVASGSKVIVRDFDGSNPRVIYDTGSESRPVGSVAWSPDGRRLAIEIGDYFQRPAKPSQIALLNFDGTGLRTLLDDGNSNGFPAFSPDGRKLVYRVFGKESGLRVLSIQDGRVTRLTTGWDNFPAWSPHGDRIVFTGYATGDFEVYSIHADGSDQRQVTSDHGNTAHPIWSPDGEWIAFVSSRKGWKDEGMLSLGAQTYGETFVTRPDGSEVRQLSDNQWEDMAVAWLPDGK